MRFMAGLGLLILMTGSWGCVECECTCVCIEAGTTEHTDTFIVDEEADCEGTCDTYTAEQCPNMTHSSFDVDCS